jgi:hypothetical protein
MGSSFTVSEPGMCKRLTGSVVRFNGFFLGPEEVTAGETACPAYKRARQASNIATMFSAGTFARMLWTC